MRWAGYSVFAAISNASCGYHRPSVSHGVLSHRQKPNASFTRPKHVAQRDRRNAGDMRLAVRLPRNFTTMCQQTFMQLTLLLLRVADSALPIRTAMPFLERHAGPRLFCGLQFASANAKNIHVDTNSIRSI